MEPMSPEEFNETKHGIEDICEDLISTSLSDARCPEHISVEDVSCEDCEKMVDLVKTFQVHKCTSSCRKKKKYIHILPGQGLGISEQESIEIITSVCRYRFPKFPIDKNIVLLPLSKDEDPKLLVKMKKDLKHIKSYLIRKTYFWQSNENEEDWLKFEKMTFEEFLQDTGMFEGISSSKSESERLALAKERYYNALPYRIYS